MALTLFPIWYSLMLNLGNGLLRSNVWGTYSPIPIESPETGGGGVFHN